LDPIRRARLFGIIVVLSMAFLGVIYPVLTATTVVETVTETVVQPGRTITTVTVLEGGDVAIRIESPGFRMTVYYEKQDQVCVVRFTAMRDPSPGVVVFPGTTIAITGTTATWVLSAPIEIATTSTLRTAFTTTGYLDVLVTRTITRTVTAWRLDTLYGLITTTYTTTYTTPRYVSLYGLFEEACNLAYEISRSRIEPMRLPATVVLAFEGTTFTFPGYTHTMTILTEFMTRDPELENFRTTFTTTKNGTTNTATVYIGPTTIVLRTRVEGSTVTTTVVMPGTTYVRTYLVTRTLAEPVATVTTTRTPQTAAQPAQAQPAVTVTTPAPGEGAGQLFDPMMLGAFAAVAVVIGFLLGYRRGRY
jgi:hypothetical protein